MLKNRIFKPFELKKRGKKKEKKKTRAYNYTITEPENSDTI